MTGDNLNFSKGSSVLITNHENAEAFIKMFASNKYLIFSIDGTKINSKKDLLSRLASEMKFPTYFGNNWDALEECLKDLNWFIENGYVIRFINADKFIKDHPSDFRVLIEIAEAVANHWKFHKVEFILIVETNDLAIAI